MARKHKIKFRKVNLVETSRNVATLHQKIETYNKTVSIVRDGNCLFRSLSYGIYDTQEHHQNIREEIVREVTNNWDTYKDFVCGDTAYDFTIESIDDYQACMGLLGTFGGHQELQAFVAVHNQAYVEIYSSAELLASYGNLTTCKLKISLLFTGNLDRGHYDFLKPWHIVESDHKEREDDYDYQDYDRKRSRKNRW